MKKHNVFDPYVKEIEHLFAKVNPNDEFEFDFNMNKRDISYERYVDILKYMKYLNSYKKMDMLKSTVLDVIYGNTDDTKRENYRLSISGNDLINNIIHKLRLRHNHVIFNTLIKMMSENKYENALEMTKKTKQKEDTVDIEELNMRIRLAKEENITRKMLTQMEDLDETQIPYISYRFKQRVSIIYEQTKDHIIRIDLTNAKSGRNINKLYAAPSVYELELEYMANKKSDILQKLYDTSTSILKVIQQSNYIVTKSISDKVLDEYERLLSLQNKQSRNLEGRSSISLELQYATEKLQNKYAVVDKADGERCFLIICDGNTYIISMNLSVKDLGIKVDGYDGTILDCEYIFLPKYGRQIVLPFDCLFHKSQDIRKNPLLMERLRFAHDVVDNCFVIGKQKGFKQSEFKGINTPDNLAKYHKEQLDKHVANLYNDLEIEKKYPLIRVKYFIPVYGLSDNEIFKYSMIIWNKYVYDKQKYPYDMDGLVYQPLDQIYTKDRRESRFDDFKWKPPVNNTIDFYIRFARDPATSKIYDVFDNTNEEDKTVNKPYRICYLYNGKRNTEGKEIPVFFNEEQKLNIAHLFTEDGVVKDKSGNIIQDDTVVEFYYDTNPDIGLFDRWKPLRTRYDKTEMVNKYQMKYGNNSEIANKVWRSIINPVSIGDIETLGDDKMYARHLELMRKKITAADMVSVEKENAYYQTITNLSAAMRQFHNWTKTVLMVSAFAPQYNNGKTLDILDTSIGRGGDIQKFYHAKVKSVVAMDADSATMHNPIRGPIQTYNDAKKKYPAFPKMSFVCADFTVPLDPESQISIITDKTQTNKSLLAKYFSKNNFTKFDGINCQFAFHYFLGNDNAWKNTCDNINKTLKSGGTMIITTFDAETLMNAFGDNNKYTLYYTLNGEKRILMDITKKFDGIPKKFGVGLAIDVYNAMISEVTITEYLVHKDFLINEMKTKCNMDLVDTDMLSNLYEINRDAITTYGKYDENLQTRKYFEKTSQFYDQRDELNHECYNITRLNRYYIFRKHE